MLSECGRSHSMRSSARSAQLVLIVVAVIFAMSGASAAHAAPKDRANSSERWGALAWHPSPAGTASGDGIDYPTEAEARQAALADCANSVTWQAPACEVVHVFNRGCAYIATGSNDEGHYGYIIRPRASEAVRACAVRGFDCSPSPGTVLAGGCIGRR